MSDTVLRYGTGHKNPVVGTGLPSMSAAEINDCDWEWCLDFKTSLQNAALQKTGGGANLLGLVGAAVNLQWPKRRSKEKMKTPRLMGPAGEILGETDQDTV